MDESFLDLISKCQSHRLDDQRSEFPSPSSSDRNSSSSSQLSGDDEDLFDTLWRLQSSRIEEQRCPMPAMAAEESSSSSSNSSSNSRQQQWQENDADLSTDELFELIFASQVSQESCVWGSRGVL